VRNRRLRLSVRVQLMLLYTGLFAACGAIMVAITYGLVAANLPKPPGKVSPANNQSDESDRSDPSAKEVPADFASACRPALADPAAEAQFRYKSQNA
jgi:hypothetical protein